MGKRRSAGQRRSEKVLARRRRARGGGTVCAGSARPAVREREPNAYDRLNAVDFDVDSIGAVLLQTVQVTVESGVASLGEAFSTRIVSIDDDYGQLVDAEHRRFLDGETDRDPYEWGPFLIAQRLLVSCLREGRRRGDEGDLARRVVDWVGTHLGRSGPAIDRLSGLLGGSDAPRPIDVTRAAEHEPLAALVWLVSGLVAVAGHGDAQWLMRRVDAAS